MVIAKMNVRWHLPERKEISDLLLAGLRTDVLDVDGIGRHDG